MRTKIVISDSIDSIELTIKEAEELYLELKMLFGKDDTKVEFWGDRQPWKDPTITEPTSGIVPNNGLQDCGKHYMHAICDCAMESPSVDDGHTHTSASTQGK